MQEEINNYHQYKGQKEYSVRFVAGFFGGCDTKSNDMFFQMVKDCYDKFDITEGKSFNKIRIWIWFYNKS